MSSPGARRSIGVAVAVAAVLAAGCTASPADVLLEPRSGGAGSVDASGADAFGHPSALLDSAEIRRFEVGDSLFNQAWVAAPSTTASRDGLGPLFNAEACSSCHVADGRAAPPSGPGSGPGLIVRISVPGAPDGEAPRPEPSYGLQLQDRAIDGLPAEGSIAISRRPVHGSYADGTGYRLAAPGYELTALGYGPLDPAVLTSPRIAGHVVGSGLLEAIAETTIVAAADPDDADGDGISGRPNWLIDDEGERILGRFGWKAAVPSIAAQVATAFAEDIGVTSPQHPDENCPPYHDPCLQAPSGGAPEIDAARLEHLVFYTQTLAVPVRRDLGDPSVVAGARIFDRLRCTACHTPTVTTGDHVVPALAGQTIHPYTDLLLHDMGPALADGRPDHSATGTEWRTPPLWGLGLVEMVNGHTAFLHDGRARSLTEAILWHGGEAEASRADFVALDAADRAAVVAFLESL